MKAVVIGAGGSLYEEKVIDQLKDYKDLTVLSTDRTLKYVLEHDVNVQYTCVQENIIRADGHDFLPDFYEHDIVRKHASNITLYHSQLLTTQRVMILANMGFKTIPFQRLGKGDGGTGEIIDTCGNNAMALVQIARKLLKIEEIAVIGLDLDSSTSWKMYENTTINQAMVKNSKERTAIDFFDNGTITYNLTELGLFHGKGIKEVSLNTFMGE